MELKFFILNLGFDRNVLYFRFAELPLYFRTQDIHARKFTKIDKKESIQVQGFIRHS